MQIIIFNWDLKARFTLMISITVQWNKYEGEMGNTVSSANGPIYDRQTFPRTERENKLLPKCSSLDRNDQSNQKSGNQENSRMLFLMYLINRTWNVVGGKRWVECTWTWSWQSKTEKHRKESSTPFISLSLRPQFVLSIVLHSSFVLRTLKFRNFTVMTTSTIRSLWKMETTIIILVIMVQNVLTVAVDTAKMKLVESMAIIQFAKGEWKKLKRKVKQTIAIRYKYSLYS